MTQPEGTGLPALGGISAARHEAMTAHFTSDAGSRYTSIAHDPVCARCGHGESLHAIGAAGCLLCDQRASAGLSSSYCNGYLADAPDRRLDAGVARAQRR